MTACAGKLIDPTGRPSGAGPPFEGGVEAGLAV